MSILITLPRQEIIRYIYYKSKKYRREKPQNVGINIMFPFFLRLLETYITYDITYILYRKC